MKASETRTTEKIAKYIVETTYEDIPEREREMAKFAMLDCLGTILSGSTEPSSQIIKEYVRELGGAPIAGVITGGYNTSAPFAALVNGTMAHALDYDDVGGFGHPTVVLLPAILSMGQKMNSSGRECLVAYVVGFETAFNISLGFQQYGVTQVHGQHSTAIFGAMSATAAAAKLARLNQEQTQRALGIAASCAAGVLANLGYHVKPFHAGNACKNGIIAVELSKRGFTAAPDVIERPVGYAYSVLAAGDKARLDFEKMTAELGKKYHLTANIGIKKYPCCYYNHRALDALLGMLSEHNIRYDDIESVELGISAELPFFHPQPTTAFQGKFSYEYNLAAAILDRQVVMGSYTDAVAESKRMQDALKKVRVVPHKEWEQIVALNAPNPVTVRLKDGRVLSRDVNPALGHALNPWPDEEIKKKYLNNAQQVLPSEVAKTTLQMMDNLVVLGNIAELMRQVTFEVIKPAAPVS